MDRNLPNNYQPGPENYAMVPQGEALPMQYQRSADPYPYFPGNESLEEQAVKFDFYKYVRIVTKYRWLIAGCVLTAVLLAALLTFTLTPIYRATSSLQIDREAMNIVKIDGVQPEEAQGGLEFFQTQYELLASRSLAERVVSTLGLATDASFNTETTSFVTFLRQLVTGGGGATEAEAAATVDPTRLATERLMRSLSVVPVRGSRIVKINIDHPDAAVTERIANGYAEVFIADNLDRRFEATSYARKFLEERLQQLRLRLEESEKQQVKYAEDQGIITLNDNKSLSSTDLEATNIKLAEVRADRIKKELLWKQAQATSGLGLKNILDSEAVQANRKLRAELSAEYQQKLGIYKPAFPLMVQLRNQIKELDRQILSEIESIKTSIEADYLAAKEEEETLLTQLEGTKTEVVDQRNRSIQYNILQREVDTNRSLYDGLLQRYKEIGIAGGVGTNNVSIVDKANQPTFPRSPSLPLNVALGFLLGTLFGLGLAVLLDYLDDSFKAPEEIERETGFPVIGLIPKVGTDVGLDEEIFNSRSAVSEAYRSLRTALQFSTSDGLPRSLLITSSRPSEGKTTTSISVAKSFAQMGLQVLLIDGDLRNASIHRRLRCSNEIGLSNYLSGAKMPEEVVQATDVTGLVLMSSGPLPPNPAELLSGPRLKQLLGLATQSFDIVIVDGPPVMGLADAPLISSSTQSTIFVVAAHETRRNVVKVALKRLQFARANVVGVLLNKFDAKQSGYGYGYGYGYGDYNYHSYGSGPSLPAPNG
jgi:polysaccharide biosynthesis transport protein